MVSVLLLYTENSRVVDLVLLDMSSCVDLVWIDSVTVWRHNYYNGQWYAREEVCRRLLRIQARLFAGGCSCRGWICSALCILL
jgi:hypothetical protein